MTTFKTRALPLLIGSLPMDNHQKATALIIAGTPEIPLWPQLPVYREEGMIAQFLPGMPGVTESNNGKQFIDTQNEAFDQAYLEFYENYLAVAEGDGDIETSIFTLTAETGKGFTEFLRQINEKKQNFMALKGQVTGPITFATGLTDENDRAIFYNDQLRDAAIKHLAMNGKWQARMFARTGLKPIIFFDEPALAGFGTSAFITITREDVINAITEVVQGVHEEGGLAGIHVCANTEWDLLLNAPIDIISFDAYAFFDKFILYPEMIVKYIERGGIMAWGIVPTSDVEDIRRETSHSLVEKLEGQIRQIEALGISRETILEQSLITPSCGTGSIDLESAMRVLELTSAVSKEIRKTVATK